MPVQVIDKKSNGAVVLHPLQYISQLFVGKMVAEEGRKNNIRSFVKSCFSEITADKGDTFILLKALGVADALGIDVYACQSQGYFFSF